MGGLPCAKVIIDMGNRLNAVLGCMNASILLNADYSQPTEEMEDEFVSKCDDLAKLAMKIEAYVGEGRTTEESYDKKEKEEDIKKALDYFAPEDDPKGRSNL